MDNEQYSKLLEYLLTGQLPEEADETYGKWVSQFREQGNHIYVKEDDLYHDMNFRGYLVCFMITQHRHIKAWKQ